MSQNWAELLLFICVVAQFFCVTASTTSASRMMFAFSRDRAVPGTRSGGASRRTASRWSVVGVAFFAAVLMIPAIWNYFIGYAVGTAIAVIGLYIAFILPVFLRLRLGDTWDEPRAWSLGRHYKWIDRIAIAWVCLITILFIFPLYTVGLPWNDPFAWQFTNYTILWFAGIGLIFGGWWALSAKKWFKGPVRMGTEEELERLEEEQAGEFALADRSFLSASRIAVARGAARRPSLIQAPSAARNAGSAAVRRVARSARSHTRRSRSRARRRQSGRLPTSPPGSRT